MIFPGRIDLRRTAPLLQGLVILLLSGAQQPTSATDLPDAAVPEDEREVAQLNVTLVVFDPGVRDNESPDRQSGIFPEIRKIEARYLPYLLRETLVETDEWGAVRVVPEADPAAELLVSGTIVKSDGALLELRLRAVDSTGRKWLNQPYAGSAAEIEDENETETVEPFQDLYDRIAADLYAARAQLDDNDLSMIAEVSLLRYANELAPEAFGDYLDKGPDGNLEIRRLPARGDPLIQRVERIREFEYLFTDTMDEQYEALYREIASTYDLWRKYRRRLAQYMQAAEERMQNSGSRAPRGSYGTMKRNYDNYRWTKIQEQKLRKWATGFNNEVAPTVMELEGRVVELKGGLEDRYDEWRGILRSIYLLETGE